MQEAKVKGQLVLAGAHSPEVAVCPACGEEVEKRVRRNEDGKPTYFWRHKAGRGNSCPLRYRPVT